MKKSKGTRRSAGNELKNLKMQLDSAKLEIEALKLRLSNVEFLFKQLLKTKVSQPKAKPVNGGQTPS